MEPINDNEGAGDELMSPEERDEAKASETTSQRKALVREITKLVYDARTFWKATFDRIREDIEFAGGDQWKDAEDKMSDKYKVNFVQRELNREVSDIYAKNPTVKCSRRKRRELSLIHISEPTRPY